MKKPRISRIKQARRESFFYSELASLFIKIVQDEKTLLPLSISRVELSDKGSLCTVYFTCESGVTQFQALLPTLLLYKPALRHALSQIIERRRSPELVFSYDAALEKARTIEEIFESLPKIPKE
jgi:ribosome-binding factor A